MIEKNVLLESAKAAFDWVEKNQLKKNNDANCGRFVYARRVADNFTDLSTNWTTGFGSMAMLSAYKITNEKRYLDSALKGVDYLKSLQIMDATVPRLCGAIREVMPQTNWLHPRDALSAAWTFLAVGKELKDETLILRASLFADWMIEHAFMGDWPICTVALSEGGTATDDLLGSFHSGGILFFLDMYKETGEIKYYSTAHRMAEFYINNFIDEDGEITVLFDSIGNNPDVHNEKKWPLDWQMMHKVNDDFGGIALVEAYKVFKNEEYLKRCSAYFKKLCEYENGDGSYLQPEVETGSATASIFLQKYLTIAHDDEKPAIQKLLDRSLEHLLKLQLKRSDEQLNGAIYGMDDSCKYGNREWVNLRITAYAIFAMLEESDASIFPIKF